MEKMKFENLVAWQKAQDLTAAISETRAQFPVEERYVLSSQIQRAADSIALNIAEGSTGQTNKVFRNFFPYPIRSGIEVIACLHIAMRRKILSEESFSKLYELTQEVLKITTGLRNSIKDE